jgi:5'-deoxynucleotidase YfbR-like HD superfamily hydrolase
MKKENSFIGTHNGTKFFPFDPKEDQVFLEDIARALSRLVRYNGHTTHGFSVAQHSINCAKLLKHLGYSDRLVGLAFLHDAAEAYIGDYPSPIKRFFPELEEIEDNILKVIFNKFNIDLPTEEEWKLVMTVDKAMLTFEGKMLTKNTDNWSELYEKNLIELFEDINFRESTGNHLEDYLNGVNNLPIDLSKRDDEFIYGSFIEFFKELFDK